MHLQALGFSVSSADDLGLQIGVLAAAIFSVPLYQQTSWHTTAGSSEKGQN